MMCRSKHRKNDGVSVKRRPRYSAEEKKVIAKNKAKRRRCAETRYFSMIDKQLKAKSSPFLEIHDKTILSVTLRLANVWKLSHFILHQEMKDSRVDKSQVTCFSNRSILRDACQDNIMMVLYRPSSHENDRKPSFIILYVTPSWQQYLHTSNSYDLFGAKFDDYCHIENESHIVIQAPPTQKEKRVHSNVRCRIIQKNYRHVSDYKLGFLLLQAPKVNRQQGICSKLENVHDANDAATRKTELLRSFAPQSWRAMQARRSAVRQGAPRNVKIPEELEKAVGVSRFSGQNTRGLRMQLPTEESIISLLERNVDCLKFVDSFVMSPLCDEPQTSSQLASEIVRGLSPAFFNVTPDDGSPQSSNQSAVRSLESEVGTPLGSQLAGDEIAFTSELGDWAIKNDGELEYDPNSTLNAASNVKEIHPKEENPLDSLVPTTSGIANLSIHELQDAALKGNPDSPCPCSLFTNALCAEFLESIKTEPVDSAAEDTKDETTPCSQVESSTKSCCKESNVTFTAHYQDEEMNKDHVFLVYRQSDPLDSHPSPIQNTTASASALQRSCPSQNLFGLVSSSENMEIGSANNLSSHAESSGILNNRPPRYLGDDNQAQMTSTLSESKNMRAILSEGDVEMGGTPYNSMGQDMDVMERITKDMSTTSIQEMENEHDGGI